MLILWEKEEEEKSALSLWEEEEEEKSALILWEEGKSVLILLEEESLH